MNKVVAVLCAVLVVTFTNSVDGARKVRLKDIDTLTLYAGKQTAGRRTSSVPQLNCVGGSAKGEFHPEVVQCYNRGWDGYDVQWECKCDMDNDYRFGKVQISCEGFDHRDDEFVLAGSCGLEYTLEHTKQGKSAKRDQHQYQSNPYKSSDFGGHNSYPEGKSTSSSGFGNLLMIIIFLVIAYIIVTKCLSGNGHDDDDDAYSAGGYGAGGGGGGGGGSGFGGGRHYPPNPPGFRPQYTTNDSCGANRGAAGGGGPGFFTGAGLGGMLGYMFGSRNNQGYYDQGYQPRQRGWWSSGNGGGWGSGYSGWRSSGNGGGSRFSSNSGGGGGSTSENTGTRTASGFGGTVRR